MSLEIEKKYLIHENEKDYSTTPLIDIFPSLIDLRDNVMRKGVKIRQGYLPLEIGTEIASVVGLDVDFAASEARLRDKGGKYFLTLKSSGGLTRNEAESSLSKTVFDLYWPYAERRIEKVRLKVPYSEYMAEIDVYADRDLATAEVEVEDEETARSIAPLGRDVTEDVNYKNKALARTDFHRKFIITGPPVCGKSLTVEYLGNLQYPVIEEHARRIIEEQERKGGNMVPWNLERFLEFQLEIVNGSIRSEESVSSFGTTFLDRGSPDGVEYCLEKGFEPPTPLKDALRGRNYRGVFVLDPLPYKPDEVRKETPKEVRKLHEGLINLYSRLGFNPVIIPVNTDLSLEDSVKARAHLILENSFSMR